MITSPVPLAFFISSHGFGHAARSVAIMNAIYERVATVRFEIFTLTPRWFFEESLQAPFSLHPIKTDIGLVQQTSLTEDLTETLNQLDAFIPFDQALVNKLAKQISKTSCQLVLCDISPLGIAVAHAAGIPSILIENFTWDWIYELYTAEYPRFRFHIEYLRKVFNSTDYHIQTEPVCNPQKTANLTTYPVSRKPKTPAIQIRRKLNIPDNHRMVLVTMGGIPERFSMLRNLSKLDGISLVIPGGSYQMQFTNHMVLLPHHSNFYHPDLVFASDAVVGKAGYSTTAEVYFAGAPFGFINRPNFRESPVLATFIQHQMAGFEIPSSLFQNGEWIEVIPQLISLPHIQRLSPNGAEQIAWYVQSLLNNDENQTLSQSRAQE
jgi:hypothetical protein